MDIMDNYPECTTQPHSCLQLRPKQLPPPLHPSGSPHDNVFQLSRGVGIFPALTKSGDGEVNTTGRERAQPTLPAACPEARVCTRNRSGSGTSESGSLRARGAPGDFRVGWKEGFLQKRSGPVGWGRRKATRGLSCDLATWHLWAFWTNVSFSKKYESRNLLPSVHHCVSSW